MDFSGYYFYSSTFCKFFKGRVHSISHYISGRFTTYIFPNISS